MWRWVGIVGIFPALSFSNRFSIFVLILDLKAFERRLTEVLACLQPNCLRWRIVLCMVTLISGISAFFWLRDPKTSIVPFFDSLLNHYIFTTSALTLITLFCYGIHKLVISPQVSWNFALPADDATHATSYLLMQIIISRTRNVLSEFNLSCDEAGKIILRSRPNAP